MCKIDRCTENWNKFALHMTISHVAAIWESWSAGKILWWAVTTPKKALGYATPILHMCIKNMGCKESYSVNWQSLSFGTCAPPRSGCCWATYALVSVLSYKPRISLTLPVGWVLWGSSEQKVSFCGEPHSDPSMGRVRCGSAFFQATAGI